MAKTNKIDSIYENITNTIIESLETEGKLPWQKGWIDGGLGIPQNISSGHEYNGTNILILWIEQMVHGYPTNKWLTYKQAHQLGANIIKGEKGTGILFAKPIKYTNEVKNPKTGKLEDTEFQRMATKAFTVFNIAQVENLPEKITNLLEVQSINEDERNEAIESLIKGSKAEIIHGGDMACFSPAGDCIEIPEFKQFRTANNYYATMFHELTHWTGGKSRLDRDMTGYFGSEEYAFEELIAELGSAFLCADTGVKVEMRHEAYIQSWLKALKNDTKFIVQAATKASKAVKSIKGEEFSSPKQNLKEVA
jgi:antirestriction protein ArdC